MSGDMKRKRHLSEKQAWASLAYGSLQQGICREIERMIDLDTITEGIATQMTERLRKYAMRRGIPEWSYFWRFDSVGIRNRRAFCKRQVKILSAKGSKS